MELSARLPFFAFVSKLVLAVPAIVNAATPALPRHATLPSLFILHVMKRMLSEQGNKGLWRSGVHALLWMLALVCFFTKAHGAPNPARSQFSQVDLADFYTLNFSNIIPQFREMPRGPQTLGGVPFVIGGKIEITGTDAARHGEFLPPQITGIPINQKASRIELLHGARQGQKDGTPLANLVLHFKNGETRKLRLAFGVHARNYLEEISFLSATQSVRELADPNSQIVWQNAPKSTNDPLARLYKTTLPNPLPDQEIAT